MQMVKEVFINFLIIISATGLIAMIIDGLIFIYTSVIRKAIFSYFENVPARSPLTMNIRFSLKSRALQTLYQLAFYAHIDKSHLVSQNDLYKILGVLKDDPEDKIIGWTEKELKECKIKLYHDNECGWGYLLMLPLPSNLWEVALEQEDVLCQM